MPDDAILPREALALWRRLEEDRRGDAAPVERVCRWIARLRARMVCSGGRLAPSLLETRLCDLETLVACVRAQLAAGATGDGAFHWDVEADLDDAGERASLEIVDELSTTVATLDWAIDPHCGLHAELAKRLVAAGREREIERVLERMAWHGPLIDWLERNGASLSEGVLRRLVARAEQLVEATHLPPVYRVGVFVDVAILASNRAWLDRAAAVCATLTPDVLEAASDIDPPTTTVAIGLATLGAFEEAKAKIASLDASARRHALLRLIPFAPLGAERAAIVDELVTEVAPLEHGWWQLVEAAPEMVDRALATIEAIDDEERRFQELGQIVELVGDERARVICASLMERARRVSAASPAWVAAWEDALEALTTARCESMLDEKTRRELVDEAINRPGVDPWRTLAPFTPDDRASAVLAHSYERLSLADHYVARDAWIAVGLPLLSRVPPEEASRWLELGAKRIARTGIEGDGRERLAAWSLEQQRAIVLDRLSHHQNEFLPHWLLEPWVAAVRKALPLVASEDPVVRSAARGSLYAATETVAWPTVERVVEVFTWLGRCEGEDGVATALEALALVASMR